MAESDTPLSVDLRLLGNVLALEMAIAALAHSLPTPAKKAFNESLEQFLKYAAKPIQSTAFKDKPEMKETFEACIKRLQQGPTSEREEQNEQ